MSVTDARRRFEYLKNNSVKFENYGVDQAKPAKADGAPR